MMLTSKPKTTPRTFGSMAATALQLEPSAVGTT
jgi:hypothetical protein